MALRSTTTRARPLVMPPRGRILVAPRTAPIYRLRPTKAATAWLQRLSSVWQAFCQCNARTMESPSRPALSLRARVAVVDQGSHKGGQTQRRCGICGFRVTHSGVATSLVAVCSSGPDRKSTIEALIQTIKTLDIGIFCFNFVRCICTLSAPRHFEAALGHMSPFISFK